jgi:hypothetical protein
MFTEMEECPTPLYWTENTEVPDEYRINIRVVQDFKKIVRERIAKTYPNFSWFLRILSNCLKLGAF